LHQYLQRWKTIETLTGIEVPLNIISLVLAIENNKVLSSSEIYSSSCLVQSVLWPRGSSVRQASLNYYNSFSQKNNRTERLLAAPLCPNNTIVIEYNKDDWLSQIHATLSTQGKAQLLISRRDIHQISNMIAVLHTTPIDTSGLFFYPRMSGIKRNKNSVLIMIELAEAIQ